MKSSNRSFPLIQLTQGYLCTTELQQAIAANDRKRIKEDTICRSQASSLDVSAPASPVSC